MWNLNECYKWKESEGESQLSRVWLLLCGVQSARLLCPWNSPGQNAEVGSQSTSVPPGDLPNPGIEPKSPALQVDSLPSELPGKPKNTEVGSHSLLQGIFPTQESEPGFPALQADSSPAELPGKPLYTK